MACSSSNWRKQRSGKQEDKQLSSWIPSAIEEQTCNRCVKIQVYSIIQHCTAKGQTCCCCHWRCSEHIDTCSRWQLGQLQSWNWTLFLWNLVHWTSPCLLFSTLAFPNIHLMTENTKASTCFFQPCSANICHAAFIPDYCLLGTASQLQGSGALTHCLYSVHVPLTQINITSDF